MEQKKKKEISKKFDKMVKKKGKIEKRVDVDDADSSVEVSYKKPKVSTTHVYEAEEPAGVKIEEINEAAESASVHSESKSEPISGEPVKDSDDEEDKDKGSGVFIWIAIIVILALIILIVNLDRIIPAKPAVVQNNDLAATVNGQDISFTELDRYYNLSVPDLMKSSITKDAFLQKSLIPQVVLLQEAKKSNIEVTDAEVSDELTKLAESTGMTKSDFLAKLDKQGITEADVVLLYKNKLTIDRLLDKGLLADAEIELPEMVKASHILVDNKDLADALLKRLKAGESFEVLAKNYSIDSTGATGGDLGYFAKGTMVPEFENATFSLAVGELSGVVKTSFGYHIIKVTDKLPAVTEKYSEITNKAQKQIALNDQMPSIQTYTKMLVDKSDIKVYNETNKAVKPSNSKATATTAAKPLASADKLADCIASKATMYGAEWCVPCNEQKKLFGASFSKINYVVCTASADNPQTDKCELANVVKYPTWIVNGQKLEGLQTLDSLAKASGCSVN